MDIFSCQSVVEVIQTFLRQGKEKVPHGARARLAKALGFHPSYLAQVLSESAALSQEQTLAFCLWAGFSADQTEFLLALLNHERAGTTELRNFYLNKKQKILDRQGQLGRSISADRLAEERQHEFFSQWDFQAVHSALQIAGLSSIPKIAEFLTLPVERVGVVLQRLKVLGLVEVSKEQWTSLQPFVHFDGKNLATRQQFHLAWRLKALERNFTGQAQLPKERLNFSSLIALDRSYEQEIFEKLKVMIGKISRDLKDVRSDHLSVLNIDFFKLR